MHTAFANAGDRFNTSRVPGIVHFANNQRTVKLSEVPDDWVNVYGEAGIESDRFEWAVRVDSCGSQNAVIGVATQSALAVIRGKFSDETTGYGFGVNGIFRNGGQVGLGKNCSLHEGDVLFVRIDLTKRRLSFAKNGIVLEFEIPQLISPESSGDAYHLAIALDDDEESYTIVNGTDYLARFCSFQYRLSQLPLQETFAYTGTRKQLSLTMHNTCITHQPPIKQVYSHKLKKTLLVTEDGVDTAYGHRWISHHGFEWVLQIQDAPQHISIGVYGQAGNNERDLKSGPWSSEFDLSRNGYGINGNGYKIHGKRRSNNLKPRGVGNAFNGSAVSGLGGIGLGSPRSRSALSGGPMGGLSGSGGGGGMSPLSFDHDSHRTGPSDDHDSFVGEGEPYCSGFSSYDLIGVRLDLINRTLSFTRNGRDLGVAFTNLPVSSREFGYRLAVKMKKKGAKCWLIAAFQTNHRSSVMLESMEDLIRGKVAMAQRALTPRRSGRSTATSSPIPSTMMGAGGTGHTLGFPGLNGSMTPVGGHNSRISSSSTSTLASKRMMKDEMDLDMPINERELFTYLESMQGGMKSASISLNKMTEKMIRAQKIKKADSEKKGKSDKRSQAMEKSTDMLRLPNLYRSKHGSSKIRAYIHELDESVQNHLETISPMIDEFFKHWEMWTHEDIADWIVGLEEGRFKRYESVLRKELKTAKVGGRHLKLLTQNITYLQRFGIIEFDEELALQGHINRLISGKGSIKDMTGLVESDSRDRGPIMMAGMGMDQNDRRSGDREGKESESRHASARGRTPPMSDGIGSARGGGSGGGGPSSTRGMRGGPSGLPSHQSPYSIGGGGAGTGTDLNSRKRLMVAKQRQKHRQSAAARLLRSHGTSASVGMRDRAHSGYTRSDKIEMGLENDPMDLFPIT